MRNATILRTALALVPVVCAISPAAAAPGTAATDGTEPATPNWSATTNLIYLVLPVANLSVERKLGPSTALSGRLGVGRITIDLPFGDDSTNTVFEIGAEYRYYLLGTFRSGLVVGGDVRFTSAGSAKLLNVEKALAVGPVVGYKHAFRFGLTLEIRVGGQIAFGEAESAIVPLVGVGAGWSF